MNVHVPIKLVAGRIMDRVQDRDFRPGVTRAPDPACPACGGDGALLVIGAQKQYPQSTSTMPCPCRKTLGETR